MPSPDYERDDEHFNADAYRLKGDKYAIAWYIRGWHVVPDADTDWDGIMKRTGDVVATMVGDNARHLYEENDFEPITDEEFCHSCGQIGCGHG